MSRLLSFRGVMWFPLQCHYIIDLGRGVAYESTIRPGSVRRRRSLGLSDAWARSRYRETIAKDQAGWVDPKSCGLRNHCTWGYD